METLINKYRTLIRHQSTAFVRSLSDKINWDTRALSVEGARGTGKSTLMLQYIKTHLPLDKTIYVSLDDLYFQNNRITEVADQFYKQGGRCFFADEVHKYPNWQQEIKNIYDFYPDLKIVVSGSSILALQRSQIDLSRRLLRYQLPELSLREFYALQTGAVLPSISLQDILKSPNTIIEDILQEMTSPLKVFGDYIQFGAYPFFKEGQDDFGQRLNQLLNLIIDYDLPEAIPIEMATQSKIKKLLYILSTLVPYTPNISKLARQLQTSRSRLLKYLDVLEKAQLVHLLRADAHGISLMNKPDRIFLHNPSLITALAEDKPNPGNIRETFFYSQLKNAGHTVAHPKNGDFCIDDEFVVEIGGKNKTRAQIQNIDNGYIVADNIEYATPGRIPLWLFGFLY